MQEQTIFIHSGNALETDDQTIPVAVLSEEPFVAVLENVLTEEECDALIALSREKLKRSKIGAEREVSDIRTSSGAFLQESENELVARIEERIARIMNVPLAHAEPLSILHYQPGQEYKAHVDYFASAANNRISTLIMYLNDVEGGGETYFPSLQLSFAPKKGAALYFEYFYNDASLNELTLHCGIPVASGEKWVATQWMRRQRYRT